MTSAKRYVHFVAATMILVTLYYILKRFRRTKFFKPLKSCSYQSFKATVKNGDLLLTRSSNNYMSRIHTTILGTPVAHVGIAVVEDEGNVNSNVFMFESSTPRGAQLRNLEDYMLDGSDCLWWSTFQGLNAKKRKKIILAIEYYSSSTYSFSFVKDLPKAILNWERSEYNETDKMSNSCGDLVAKVYRTAGLLKHENARFLPFDFIQGKMKFVDGVELQTPQNVIFTA